MMKDSTEHRIKEYTMIRNQTPTPLTVCCFSMILLFVFMSLAYALDLSVEEKEYLRKKEMIVFISQTSYPPFEFVAGNGQHEGMMLDVARWLAMEMGFQPVFIDMTFQEAQEAVVSGRADVLTSLFYSDKRKERFEFTETLFNVPASIFVRAERTDIQDINDLNGKMIAVQRGDYAKDFLEANKIRFNTLDTTDFAEATDRVVEGRADAVIGDEQIVFHHIFSSHLTDHVKKVGKPLYIGRNCMAAAKGNAILVSILNKGISEAGKTGMLDKINKKWLGEKYVLGRSFLETYLLPLSAAAGGLLVLSLWVWVWNVRLRSLVRQKTEAVTHRENELRESEKNFRTFFETIDDMIFVGDMEGKIHYTNPAVSRKLGYTQDELQQMHILQVHPAEKREQAEAIFAAMFKYGLDVCPLPLQSKAGSLLPVETRAWFGKWNGENCIFGISKDLTKEQEVLQLFNQLFNNNPTLMALTSLPERRFTDVNAAFLNMLGYSREEIIGKTSVELELFPDSERQRKIAEQLQAKGRVANCELQVKCKDGTILEGIFFGEMVESQGKKYFLTVMIDDTQRREAESQRQAALKSLEESELRYRSLVENANEIVFRTDDAGRFTFVNPATIRISGYEEEEVIGKHYSLFIRPDLRDQATEFFDGQFRNGINNTYYRYPIITKEGGEVWLAQNTQLIVKDGRIEGSQAVARDITLQRKAEEALKEALREKDVLLREIHHRVKNNMQVISSLLTLQAERVESDEVRYVLLESQQRIMAMAMIHEALYGSQNLATIDLSVYLGRLVEYLREVYSGDGGVSINLDLGKVELSVDQAVLCGLIINELVTNSFKHAFPDGKRGTIQIRVRLVNGKEMVLEVSDNGVGLPRGLAMEDPSTLGLRLVHGLLKHQLDGSLELRLRGGTAFTLRWPLLAGKGESS
jgi:PAS domain S-box-containing protein